MRNASDRKQTALIRHPEKVGFSKSGSLRAATNCPMASRTGPAGTDVATKSFCIAGNTSVIPSSIICFSTKAIGDTMCIDPSERLLAAEKVRKISIHCLSPVSSIM